MLQSSPFTLTATNIAKKFGGKQLFKDWSFTLQSGTRVAITGPSGSGKTTLLNCVGLLENLDAGTIACGSYSIPIASRKQQREFLRNELGFLFQNYGLVERWTAQQNLAIAANINPAIQGRRERKRAIEQALERVGLAGMQRHKVYTLSGGEQQRVALARLILKNPSIVLADEPTSALDEGNANLVLTILEEMAQAGAMVLLSTHNQAIADDCEDRLSLSGILTGNNS